jgi:hypothetical protein
MSWNATRFKLRLQGSTLSCTLVSIACAGAGWLAASCAICTYTTAEDRNAGDLISQDIREARTVESPDANKLVLRASHGDVIYTFDAPHHTLSRAAGSKSQNLITGVDSFAFSLLRPSPYRGKGALILACPSNARAVACHWSCSKKVAWVKLHTHQISLGATLLRNR